MTAPHPNDPQTLEVTLHDESDMDRFAGKLAVPEYAPLVIGLIGDLGAGKTRFATGFAVALGCAAGDVTSPTFTLVQEYPTTPPVIHVDTYRLNPPDEFADLGLDEDFERGFNLIEWADRVDEYLPPDRLTLRLRATGETRRQVTVSASGPQSLFALNGLRKESASNSSDDN